MKIQQTIPVLPSADFERTVRFYRLIGFHMVSTYPEYLILICGEQELHFFLEAGDHTYGHGHSHFSTYMRTAGLDDLYQAVRAAGIETDPPSLRPWGLNEMELIDPDGTLLRFGERIDPAG